MGRPTITPVLMPRAPLACLLLTLTPAAAGAQVRCLSRVEASPSVPAALLVRLTASLPSGASDDAAARCPAVRFDQVGTQLVMTVVLEDGRQVARVLPTPGDAAPTLVALTATPRGLAPVETPEGASEPSAVPEPSPVPQVVGPTSAEALPPPPRATVPTEVLPVRAWPLRAGVFGTFGHAPEARQLGLGMELDLTLRRWTAGLRGAVLASPAAGGQLAGELTLAVRARWQRGAWELDAGPTLGLRWSPDARGPARQAGAEATLARRFGSAWWVYARVTSAAVFANEDGERDNHAHDRDGHGVGFAGGMSLGVRASLP